MSEESSSQLPQPSGNELLVQATLRHENWALREMGTVRVEVPGSDMVYFIKNQGLGTANLYMGDDRSESLLKTSTCHRNWLMAKLGFGDFVIEAPHGLVARLEGRLSEKPVLHYQRQDHPVELTKQEGGFQIRILGLNWIFRYTGKTATVSGAVEGMDFFVCLLLANYFWLAAVES